jgi:hypothetical protein
MVMELLCILWYKQTDNERTGISNKYTSRSMNAGLHRKIVQKQACKETNDQQAYPRNRERQPKNKKKIEIRNNKLVKKWYLV